MRGMIGRLAAVAVGAIAASSLTLTTAGAQQFTMKLSSPTINDVVHEYYKTLKTGVEARSGGRIKVEIYPANQLGQLPAVVEGVALGTIEVGSAANGFWVGLEPRFQVLDAPGLFDDVLHGYRILNDPAIRTRLATFGADKGIEILTPAIYSPLMLLSHKAIRAVADFQGQKVRTQGGAPIQVEPLKKVGDDYVGSQQKADSIAGKLIPKDLSNRWHNLVASNVAIALGSRLKGTKCDIYVNGMRVKLKNNLSCYPDVVVVSGDPSFADPEGQILLNPTVVIEGVSKDTNPINKTAKL